MTLKEKKFENSMNSALGGIDGVISIKENFQTDINIESNKTKIQIDYIAQSQMTIFNKAKEVFSKIGKNVFKNKYKNWDYYATPITIDGQNYIVEFDTVLRDNGQKHFRLERIYLLEEVTKNRLLRPARLKINQ